MSIIPDDLDWGLKPQGQVFREPTKAFSLGQVTSYLFKPTIGALGWAGQIFDLVKRAYYCAVSSIVQVIRSAGFMHAANVVGSLGSDFTSALRIAMLRKGTLPFSSELPVDPSKVIVLYLPSKDGQWRDYNYLNRQLISLVGEDKVSAQYIESWEGGGNMTAAHIAQVREKLQAIKKKCPNNPIVVVGWSHGAETLPWAFMDPNSYGIDEGVLYCAGGQRPRPLSGGISQVDHVIRLCSPMTEGEVDVMRQLPKIGLTEVCGKYDCLLPSEPQVSQAHQTWVESGHLGCVFSSEVAKLIASRVLHLHGVYQSRPILARLPGQDLIVA